MKNAIAIAQRELESYFAGPLAFVVAATLLALGGFFFIPGLVHGYPDLTYWMSSLGLTLVILVPALTMRLLAEERRTGTLELLLTSPVREWEVVAGKYLGSILFFMLLLLLLLQYPISFLVICRPDDPTPVYAGMLGLLLFGAFFLSVGLFFSSLTRSQAAAYFATFSFLLFLYFISWLKQPTGGFWGEFLNYLSLRRQLFDFAHGVVDSRDVLFYLSGIGMYLFLSVRSLLAFR